MEINALEKIYNHFKKTNANVIQFNYIEFDEQKFNVLEKAFIKYMLATIRQHYNAIPKDSRLQRKTILSNKNQARYFKPKINFTCYPYT